MVFQPNSRRKLHINVRQGQNEMRRGGPPDAQLLHQHNAPFEASRWVCGTRGGAARFRRLHTGYLDHQPKFCPYLLFRGPKKTGSKHLETGTYLAALRQRPKCQEPGTQNLTTSSGDRCATSLRWCRCFASARAIPGCQESRTRQ